MATDDEIYNRAAITYSRILQGKRGKGADLFFLLDKWHQVENKYVPFFANPAIRPPGFEGQPANHARGHLLANSLGGAGNDARNLVTLFQRNANHPNMSSFERQVRSAVQNGETVSYRAIPIYTGTSPIPTGVTLSARGSSGLTLDVSIPNINGAR